MSSNAIRAVAVVLVLLAIILAVIGYKQAQRYAAGGQVAATPESAQPQPSVPQTLVVVATKPLPVNKPIDRDSVALVPVQVAPTEYFTNVDDVVKRAPLLDIDAGAPITPRFFKENNILARSIPPGHLGLSLKVDDVVGAGGFARPGDVVDVLLYLRSVTDTPTGEKGKDAKADIATQARFLLKNALVLSYEDHLVEAPKGIDEKDKDKQQNQRRERTAVLAVPEADVTRVMLGASLGELRLALHAQGSALATTEPAPATTPAAVTPGDTTTAPALAATAAPAGQAAAAGPPATVASGAPPATSTAAVSAMPAAAGEVPPVLPLSDAEKAKAEAAKVPDSVITAAELGKVSLSPDAEKKKKAVAAKPRVEIFRGSTREQSVYP